MTRTLAGLIVLACLTGWLALVEPSHGLETRVSPASNRSTSASARLQKQPQQTATFKGSCGSLDDLANRVEVCAKPVMDILQGTLEVWPRNEQDAMKMCESFAVSERCIREAARKCGKGIQKTIISTLAHAVSKARKRECSKSKWSNIVVTTTCLEKHNDKIQDWMASVTGRFGAIETQTLEAEKKINGLCCMVHDMEIEIKNILDPLCPDGSAMVSRLYRTVSEEVLDLVCRSIRCKDYMAGYKVTKNPNFTGLISVLLRIVFSLDV